MCGISGFVGKADDALIIDRMVRSQNHRGPDASATWQSKDGLCQLGHNRLKILDMSNNAAQPMSDSSGRYTMVFNGEIYNYLELKKELSDYPYKSQSDTEVLLAAYIKWGENCLSKLIGMFAIAIWDNQEKTLFCARDRLGIKPFNYAHDNGIFYFASEIKAILSAGVKANPNWDSWTTYLNHGIYDHDNQTFFENIYTLPAGHTLLFKDNKISIRQYWNLAEESKNYSYKSFDDAKSQYWDLLNDAIKLRLRSDVPVGVNVSGGLDSSSLFACIDQQTFQQNDLNAFTIGFTDPQYDETNYVSSLPQKLNWHNIQPRFGSHDLWQEIPHTIYHQEAPFGGIGTLAYAMLHKHIRGSGTIVSLEGQGVDECIAGYKYYQIPKTDKPTYQDGTSFLSDDCIHKDIKKRDNGYPEFKQPFSSELNNRLYQDLKHTKLPRVLRMNDRLSMAHGIELREPFLDHRLVELCFALPDDCKINDGQGKYILRQVMSDVLPDAIVNEPKRAVVTPQREWIRNDLKDNINDLIHSQSFKERGIFNLDNVHKSFSSFCDGEGDNAFFIWQWIIAENWFSTFIDQK